jgi:hypothetical protein
MGQLCCYFPHCGSLDLFSLNKCPVQNYNPYSFSLGLLRPLDKLSNTKGLFEVNGQQQKVAGREREEGRQSRKRILSYQETAA